ncbi:hypothetical protein Y032_0183g909 [Ancylostoma ceylanicum]|uniref:choline-phosphate cytidylyltransferase n=3 Tax=Ancylostoma ceylanicum TaxID=53326 RepID=A0A016SRH0_9BILA|nr:hypothetical protein Y032_0183g909 [Ancylostoma ceylanicum]
MIHLVVSFFHGALVNRWALDSGVDVDGSHAAWRKKCSTFESGPTRIIVIGHCIDYVMLRDPGSESRRMASGDQRFVPYTLTQLRNGDFPQNRPIHIFAEGVYDLFHYGHARQLRQVKEAFPNVIVTAGLCSDELVIKNKGGPLVMTYEERVASVKECRYVDNVIDHGMFYPTIELLDRIQVPYVFFFLNYSL